MTRRKLSLLPLAAAALMCGCSDVPSHIISPEKMANVMAEVEIAETLVEMEPSKFRGDSVKKVLLQSVYSRNGVTWDQVDSSLMWYGQHIDKYSQVMKRSVEILEMREEDSRVAGGRTVASSVSTNSVDGDSVDIWPLPRLWRIAAVSPSQMVRFNLSRDRNWDAGDGFELRFKVSDVKAPVDADLAVDCQSDKRIYISKRFRGNGWHSLSLRLDSAARAMQVYGEIAYSPRRDERIVIDSISLIRTHWKRSRSAVPAAQQTVRKR